MIDAVTGDSVVDEVYHEREPTLCVYCYCRGSDSSSEWRTGNGYQSTCLSIDAVAGNRLGKLVRHVSKRRSHRFSRKAEVDAER